MKRLRNKKIDNRIEFNSVFKKDANLYKDSYKNLTSYNKLLKLNLFSNGTFLDFGCGGGLPLSKLKNKYENISMSGVDISDIVINNNKIKYPSVSFYETNDFFIDNNVHPDNIVSLHTIEHLEDPEETVKKLLQKAQTSLLIIVPYKTSWNNCEQHLWSFDRHSFDKFKPSNVIIGYNNVAGNTEILYYWNKKNKLGSGRIFFFRIAKILKMDIKGIIKTLLNM